MSTTPEDHPGPENTTSTPEGGGKPTFEPAGTEAPPRDEAPAEPETDTNGEDTDPGEDAEEALPAEPSPGGVLSAETFTIAGLILLGVTVMSGQLIEILTSMILVDGQPIEGGQIRQIRIQLMTGGSMALIAVILGGLALSLTDAGSRHWARWGSAATILVGLMFVVVAAVAVYMIPEAAPQMMPPPMPN